MTHPRVGTVPMGGFWPLRFAFKKEIATRTSYFAPSPVNLKSEIGQPTKAAQSSILTSPFTASRTRLSPTPLNGPPPLLSVLRAVRLPQLTRALFQRTPLSRHDSAQNSPRFSPEVWVHLLLPLVAPRTPAPGPAAARAAPRAVPPNATCRALAPRFPRSVRGRLPA